MNRLSLRNNRLKFQTQRITDHFRGIYRIYLRWIKKKNWKMSTCNQLDLESLGSWPTMPKNFPGTRVGCQDFATDVGAFHIMAGGRHAVDFHRSNCTKPRVRPLGPCLLFDEVDWLLKEIWVGREWKPKLWSRGHRFIFIKIWIIGKILAVRLKGLF